MPSTFEKSDCKFVETRRESDLVIAEADGYLPGLDPEIRLAHPTHPAQVLPVEERKEARNADIQLDFLVGEQAVHLVPSLVLIDRLNGASHLPEWHFDIWREPPCMRPGEEVPNDVAGGGTAC